MGLLQDSLSGTFLQTLSKLVTLPVGKGLLAEHQQKDCQLADTEFSEIYSVTSYGRVGGRMS